MIASDLRIEASVSCVRFHVTKSIPKSVTFIKIDHSVSSTLKKR